MTTGDVRFILFYYDAMDIRAAGEVLTSLRVSTARGYDLDKPLGH